MRRFPGSVSRRLLLAAVLAAGVIPAHGSVLPPQRSLRALGGRQVWLPICGRRGINGSAPWFDGTNTAVMDQQGCFAPSWGAVTAIRLVYAGFDMPQQGEVDRPVTATVTASIFLPSANVNTVIGNTGVAAGATSLLFSATALGANSISQGQTISSSGGAIAAGTYVTSVANSFVPGAGNAPSSTVVGLSAGTTAPTANGQPFTFTGSITPVRFGGSRTLTIVPAHDVIASDPVPVEIAPGGLYFIRTAATFSGTGMQLMDYPGTGTRITGSVSEFDSRSTSLNDQTLTPVTLANAGGGYWGPVAVLGLVTPAAGQTLPGTVLILGDSIAAGTGDTADSLYYQGYIQRSLENAVPFVSAARGSTTAFGLAAHGDGQYALSVDTGVTDVLLEPGRNDVELFSIGAGQLESYIASIASRYVVAGKRVWCFTLPPSTQSNDGWTTLANQSWTVASNKTGGAATSAGSTTIGMASVANLAVGQAIAGPGIAAGTTVAAINAAALTVTASSATTAAIPAATTLLFGTATPGNSAAETQRQTYNTFLRANYSPLGCSGVIDDDSVFADTGGSYKWRVDLGAASIDGVHPSAVLHQAAVSAGIIRPAMFAPP